jgi:alanine dehydrogenase
MVLVLRDDDLTRDLDVAGVIERIEQGYLADGRGEVVLFPRTRTPAQGTTLSWMGAALPPSGLLGFRSYLYRSDGYDHGHQVVALYGHRNMELRALFLGRLVGSLRTGATIAAAFHLIDPSFREFGLIGTGYQARNALACLVRAFRSPRFVAWSPNRDRRTSFRAWARSTFSADLDLADGPADVVARSSAVALVTASDSPVVRREMLREPRLLLSISSYRRPEIDPAVLDEVRHVWTDSVVQASGPGTLFEQEPRRSKLLPLSRGLEDGALRDVGSTRIVLNTGAAWEEVLTAELLFERASERGLGTKIELPGDPVSNDTF